MARYLPISQLPSTQQVLEQPAEYGPLGWDIPLPAHIDPERLEVNVSKLGILHKVAALTASLVTEYHGDKSGIDAVVGINPDGSAIAGKSKMDKGEKSNTDLVHSDTHNPAYRKGEKILFTPFIVSGRRAGSWGQPIVNHRLNREEMIDQITGSNSKKDDHHKWAVALNGALKDSYRQAIRANLTTVNRIEFATDVLYTPLFYAQTVDSMLTTGHPSMNGLSVPYIVLRFASFALGSSWNVVNGAKPLNEYRPSLFASAQFDRYVAARALTGSSKLVRAQP